VRGVHGGPVLEWHRRVRCVSDGQVPVVDACVNVLQLRRGNFLVDDRADVPVWALSCRPVLECGRGKRMLDVCCWQDVDGHGMQHVSCRDV